MYEGWVYVHLAGVFGRSSLTTSGLQLTFRLRAERDPARAVMLLEMSDCR